MFKILHVLLTGLIRHKSLRLVQSHIFGQYLPLQHTDLGSPATLGVEVLANLFDFTVVDVEITLADLIEVPLDLYQVLFKILMLLVFLNVIQEVLVE